MIRGCRDSKDDCEEKYKLEQVIIMHRTANRCTTQVTERQQIN